MMDRRVLIGGLGLFVAAPAIVRASSLMSVKPLVREAYYLIERRVGIHSFGEDTRPLGDRLLYLSGRRYTGGLRYLGGQWTDNEGRIAHVDFDNFVDVPRYL